MNRAIPFSPPDITQAEIDAVTEVLRSGWITTGSKVREFETLLHEYLDCSSVVCVSSATAGLELALRVWGVGPGDEVIVPAYTYTATASVVLHLGATPVMVDCKPGEFNLDVRQVEAKIGHRTKAVIPVDFGGWPVDYDELFRVIEEKKSVFEPRPGTPQGSLGRVLILADSAHALGAEYKGKRLGSVADITVFSFHAVKNLTTAEGGCIALKRAMSWDDADFVQQIRLWSLHGQSKDALAKSRAGNWKYEILLPGYKYNMTDIAAAMGIVQLKRYDEMLNSRMKLTQLYSRRFQHHPSLELPLYQNNEKTSAFHLYPIRLKDCHIEQRDKIIRQMTEKNIGVNVHFIPLPLMPLYKSLAYDMNDYPHAYKTYSCEISLPLYSTLKESELNFVAESLLSCL